MVVRGRMDIVQISLVCKFAFFSKVAKFFLNLIRESICWVYFCFCCFPSSFCLTVSAVTIANSQPLSNSYELIISL